MRRSAIRSSWLLPLVALPALALGQAAPPPARAQGSDPTLFLPWLGRAAERGAPPRRSTTRPPDLPSATPAPPTSPSPTPQSPPQPGRLRLSEVAPTGSELLDEDGETSDWVELHNAGDDAVSLGGFALTDDAARPARWRLPAVTLAPDERRVVFASGKDRPTGPADGAEVSPTHHWETAVQDGSRWRYTVAREDIPGEWQQPDFDASGWEEGPGGIGYGDGDDQSAVPEGTISVYARTEFVVRDIGLITDLLLHMDADDGFVAYLNGAEVARQGLDGEPPAWSELADEHEARLYQGQTPAPFHLDSRRVEGLLTGGRNVLAVQVHNVAPDSSDLTLRPFLHVGLVDEESQFGPNPPWFVPPDAGTGALHASFRLKAGEALQLTAPDGSAVDTAAIPADLHRGHALARMGEAWCLTDSPSPGEANGGSCYTGYAAPPAFSLGPGFYTGRRALSLSGAEVRYTTNGQPPGPASARFSQPIALTRSAVVRAVALEPGKLPSEVVTGSYFIDERTELPVVSVVASPGDLFNGGAGGGPAIYDNYESGLKVPGEVAYFDAGKQLRFSEPAALRIVGNFSKAFAQKPMQFTFEDDFGARGDVPNALFDADKPGLGKLHGFRVRNMDDDASAARMRDVVANRMALPTHAAATASQNVAVFVNGAYWGHYVARELLNAYYVRDNFGADPDDVEIVKTHVGERFADAGSMADFDDLAGFLSSADLSDEAAMTEARGRADLDNWVDYWALQVYIANGDWYSSQWLNNTQAFRDAGGADRRWRFVLWDTAYSQALAGGNTAPEFDSLAYALSGPERPNPYSDMFNGLLRNEAFRRHFVNRFADLMNDAWATERVLAIIDANARAMASEVSPNRARWSGACGDSYCPPDPDSWRASVSTLEQFHRARPAHQRRHLMAFFGLEKAVSVTLRVEPPGAGRVRISTVAPEAYPWTGVYFDGNPVTIVAEPAAGYAFAGWAPNGFVQDPARPELTANIDAAATTFTARFAPLRR